MGDGRWASVARTAEMPKQCTSAFVAELEEALVVCAVISCHQTFVKAAARRSGCAAETVEKLLLGCAVMSSQAVLAERSTMGMGP